MAEPTTFTLTEGQEAERKLLKTFVNVGTTSTTKSWELIGDGIEDSSIEYNTDMETKTDITGVTRTKVNKTEPTQSFEPYTIKGGSKLAFILWDIYKRNAVSELSKFEVLIVYEFVSASDSTTTKYQAEVQTGCTITVTSIGGSAYVDMPISINYSNNKQHGTVTYTGDVPTFTATSGV